MKLVFAKAALRDIAQIYQSISARNPAAALRVEKLIKATCERLTEFPFIAAATDLPDIYRLPLVRYPYAVFYRVDLVRDCVEIIRVVHGARIKDLNTPPDEA
jgi:toxin ParE1/3/4